MIWKDDGNGITIMYNIILTYIILHYNLSNITTYIMHYKN